MKKIESIAEYQQLASRTCPDLGTFEDNYFHMQTGITTEIGEAIDPLKKFHAYKKPIDFVNVGEELADTCWYIANKSLLSKNENIIKIWSNNEMFEECIKHFKKTFKEIKQNDIKEVYYLLLSISPSIYTCDALQMTDEQINMDSVGIEAMTIIYIVAEMFNLDFYQLLTNNIAKLKVRYPDKFTNEAAINRNLEEERTELEK